LLEHTALLRIERWPKWLACGYTLAMVVLGFVIFRAENLLEGMAYLSRMFSFSPESPRFFLMLSPLNILAFSIAIPVALMPRRRLNPFLCALLLVLALMSITASGYHPFIYFRF
jgi:Predicted membrane protein involved in D-alanine export